MKHLIPLLALLCLVSCHNGQRGSDSSCSGIAMQPCPTFEADSAMLSIEAQCAFGPRVPGTDAWQQCGDWIAARFAACGLSVEEQQTEVTRYDGVKMPCRNIIASFRPEATDRILLCTHWDSRPWADNDPDAKNHHTPILAANDGASGVAVMLELARLIQGDTLIHTGIDFVCFDAEDSGYPHWETQDIGDTSDTWCLGSRYWAEQAAQNGYHARFGILFDMVGGLGSTFSMEGYSKHYAEPVAQTLWHIGRQLGYTHYFPLRDGGYITDDHLSVNRIARIPCIDVVPCFETAHSSFGPTWHTVNDTPENIDPNVLEAVGQSVLQMIYNDNGD